VRADPSANNNSAIQEAYKNGHIAVVDQLLLDVRVRDYSSAKDNDAPSTATICLEAIRQNGLALQFDRVADDQ